MTRNYKRPWDQDSISGSGSFAVSDMYARFVLSKSAPSVRLLSIGDPTTGNLGCSLPLPGDKAPSIHWVLHSGIAQFTSGDLSAGADAVFAATPFLPNRVRLGFVSHHCQIRRPIDNLPDYVQDAGPTLACSPQKRNDTGDKVDFALQIRFATTSGVTGWISS